MADDIIVYQYGRFSSYDHYAWLADALLDTLKTGQPFAVDVPTFKEGGLLRVRVANLMRSRLHLSPWHWISAKHTRAEPTRVYFRIAKLATPAQLMARWRSFPADTVKWMLEQPPVCMKLTLAMKEQLRKVPYHRRYW